MDFGGIAKGWAVDLAARSAIEAGLGWALVNAGGDIRVAGTTREAEIAIEDPFDRSKELARIVITEGAVATSSTTRRTWGPGLHHLIDPRTGEPASLLEPDDERPGRVCRVGRRSEKPVPYIDLLDALGGGVERSERVAVERFLLEFDVVPQEPVLQVEDAQERDRHQADQDADGIPGKFHS